MFASAEVLRDTPKEANTKLLEIIPQIRANLITQLNLSSHDIDANDAIILSEVLKENFTVTEINLRANNIGNKGANQFAG